MIDILDFPQYLEEHTLKQWLTEGQFPNKKLYIEDRLFTQRDLNDLLKALNLQAIKDKVKVSFGWTLKRTYMKMYPTDKRIHSGNKAIDYNLYTLLEPFTSKLLKILSAFFR